jgi:MFS family permease
LKKIRHFGKRTFASLKVRNYRLYFLGQGISMSGTWMQSIGQGLLILKLTGSGTDLGLITALQFLPVLVLGPWAGVVVDRFPKRKMLYITQTAACIIALTLGLLVATNLIQIWMVYILGLCLGFVNAFDNPTRQTFVMEMVGKDLLRNAVSLGSSEMNLARVIGPILAGGLIAWFGLAVCFIVNGLTYIPVLIALFMIRSEELHLQPLVPQAKGQLMEGFRYVRHSPLLRNTLFMMAIIGTLSYEFSITLPLLSQFTFHGDASSYAYLTAAMGTGAVVGGLFTASRQHTTPRMLVRAAFLFGLSILLTSLAPSLFLAILAMLVVGFFSLNFTSLGNVVLQLETTPQMRGRVMALWTVAFMGSTPIGGPIVGLLGEHLGPRFGLGIGGVAGILASAWGFITLPKDLHEKT